MPRSHGERGIVQKFRRKTFTAKDAKKYCKERKEIPIKTFLMSDHSQIGIQEKLAIPFAAQYR